MKPIYEITVFHNNLQAGLPRLLDWPLWLVLLMIGAWTSKAQPLSGFHAGNFYISNAEMDSARTKAWWFFGDTVVTHEGIDADVRAFREAGLGGVVYYDQIHGKGNNAPQVFSPQWWSDLKYAALAAKREGLTFEINVSNGYVAGGPWITDETSMQMASQALGLSPFSIGTLSPGTFYYALTYLLSPGKKSGKAKTSAMNVPGPPADEFYGTNYIHLDPPARLEASDDSLTWRTVCDLRPTRSAMSTFTYEQTIAFPPTAARHFRILWLDSIHYQPSDLKYWHLEDHPLIDAWQQKAGFHSAFLDSLGYQPVEGIKPPVATPLTVKGIPTNKRIKHGRPGMSGLHCDNFSRRAVELQWNNYVRPICDTLASIGCKPMGVTIDSHEAGPQNWTPLMPQRFKELRGYDLEPFLPALWGNIVGSTAETERFLLDYRRTCADLINSEFFGAFDSLARTDGLTFTAQAIGNGLSIVGDNIAAKGRVQKPQGEFWAYQVDGNYDVKEASSAAHLYGKPIASAEAFTDAGYDKDPSDLKRIADLAYVFGINEFVVCAIPNLPFPALHSSPLTLHYLTGGREYGINRSNAWWHRSRPFWDYQARTAALLRKGKPIVDVAIYFGADAPIKILAHRVPLLPDGYDWDACTWDALRQMQPVDGEAVMPSGMRYRAIYVAHGTRLMASDSLKLKELQEAGVRINTLDGIEPDCAFHRAPISHNGVWDDRLYFCHRRADEGDIYFIVNHSPSPYEGQLSLRSPYTSAVLLDPMTGLTQPFGSLSLQPYESVFILTH